MQYYTVVVTLDNVEAMAELHDLDLETLRKKVEEANAKDQFYMIQIAVSDPEDDIFRRYE